MDFTGHMVKKNKWIYGISFGKSKLLSRATLLHYGWYCWLQKNVTGKSKNRIIVDCTKENVLVLGALQTFPT